MCVIGGHEANRGYILYMECVNILFNCILLMIVLKIQLKATLCNSSFKDGLIVFL